MTEYGRIHTDGSRSGGQPVQADIDAMESILWVDTIIDDREAIAKAFARHRLAERAAIVAFLRETIFNCTFEDIPSAIEAGEHLK